jgi:hypothetical protein
VYFGFSRKWRFAKGCRAGAFGFRFKPERRSFPAFSRAGEFFQNTYRGVFRDFLDRREREWSISPRIAGFFAKTFSRVFFPIHQIFCPTDFDFFKS